MLSVQPERWATPGMWRMLPCFSPLMKRNTSLERNWSSMAGRVVNASEKERDMAKYRAGVIGLGWMGMLSDLAGRIWDPYHVDDVDRPTPKLDIHRRFHLHEYHRDGAVPHSWAEVTMGSAGD